jgi:hypothetical protein
MEGSKVGKRVRVLVVGLAMHLQSHMTSIGFENPLAFLIIPVSLPILFLLYLRSRKRSLALAKRLGRVGRPSIAKALAAVKLFTPILIAFAAAQPYTVSYSYTTITLDNVLEVNTTSTRIVVLLDISKSMSYADTYPSRIGNAVSIVKRVAEMAVERGDALDVYGFSSGVKPLCIAVNKSSLESCRAVLDSVELEQFSAVGDAIYFGYAKAMASAVPTAVVLVTDGGHNYGAPADGAVKSVASAGIPMALVLVGRDPRASSLEKACEEAGVPLFRVGVSAGEEDVLHYVAEKLYAKARFEALKAAGQLQVVVQKRDYTIQLYALLALIPLIAASVAEGI